MQTAYLCEWFCLLNVRHALYPLVDLTWSVCCVLNTVHKFTLSAGVVLLSQLTVHEEL